MESKERLIELLKEAGDISMETAFAFDDEITADYLTKNGVIALPCKIGDLAWGIRSYHGVYTPQQGIVSEMHFLPDMTLQIVVKHISRGEYGKSVFKTREEAEAAIQERRH